MNLRINSLILTLAGLTVVVVALTLHGNNQEIVKTLRDRLEWTAYDLRMRALLPSEVEPDPRIVILDIDEYSLREEGHWPWPRWKLAQLVDRLVEYQVAVVGFDVVFAEKEANPAQELTRVLTNTSAEADTDLLARLSEMTDLASPDQRFADAIGNAPVVLGYVFSGNAEHPVGTLPQPLDVADVSRLNMFERSGYVANLGELQAAALSAGFFSVQPDGDGIIRRAPLVARFEGGIYPSLALEVARAYLGMPPMELGVERIDTGNVLETVSLGGMINVPTDGTGRVLIPYRGRSGSFPYVSATDVLKGSADPEILRDAIVLVGTSAEGLVDVRATPIQSVYPGVEVHANIIAGILDDAFVSQPLWVAGVDFMVLTVLGIILAFLFPRLSAGWLLITTASVVGLYIFSYLFVWQQEGLNISVTLPVGMVLTQSTLNMTYGFLQERRNRELLKDQFGQYVPPQVVEKILTRPGSALSFEGESRELTVMFADIRSFTSLSEKLSANDLKSMLNFYFTEMTRVIFEHRGTIDKYVGDMVMAFWGAPLEDPQHRANALGAALAMLERLEKMQEELQTRGWPPLHIGIGLNSGLMNVGDMGSVFRRSYTVIGDAVNLGSRLEGLSKFYGVGCVVSEFTRADQNQILFRKLDVVRVKGKDDAVAIFQPVGKVGDVSEPLLQEIDEYDKALAAYFDRKWQEAGERFSALHHRLPRRKLYGLYLERIGRLVGDEPPPDWDGVYTHTEK